MEADTTAGPAGPSEEDPTYRLLVDCNQLAVDIDNELVVVHNYIRDRYRLRFPELDSLVQHPIDYARVAKAIGNEIDITNVDLDAVLPQVCGLILCLSLSHSDLCIMVTSQLCPTITFPLCGHVTFTVLSCCNPTSAQAQRSKGLACLTCHTLVQFAHVIIIIETVASLHMSSGNARACATMQHAWGAHVSEQQVTPVHGQNSRYLAYADSSFAGHCCV